MYKSLIVDVEIEGTKYPCQVDTGSNVGSVVLHSEILQAIKLKEYKGKNETFDVKGNCYHTEKFKIPLLKIQDLEVLNAVISQESIERLNNSKTFIPAASKSIKKPELPIAGRISINLFKPYVCMFDFDNAVITLLDKVPDTVLKRWTETNLDSFKDLVAISINTDLGIKKFILDTGVNVCMLEDSLLDKHSLAHKSHLEYFPPGRWIFQSLKMEIGDTNFGNQQFILLEFGKPMESIDGLLGIDFFYKHPMYLDFPNGKVYLQPPRKGFLDAISHLFQ
jgi:hypothetical protein